jgi:uncharacterized RDD family membrane protein YckC
MTSGSQWGTPGQPPQGSAGPAGSPGGAGPQEPAQPQGGYAQQGYGQQDGGAGQQDGGAGQQWAAPQSGHGSPVPMIDTRVTFRRVVQYVLDHILAAIVPAIIYLVIGGGRHGVLQAIGWLVAIAAWLVIMVWYWIIRPYGHGGQTFGMKLLGLRIVSKDGDRASQPQLVIRWIMLIFDTLFVGLVGLITMLCSRYRQRLGDHLARTLVVRSSWRADLGEQVMGHGAQAPVPGRTP